MDFFKDGASIECERAEITTRKFCSPTLIKHPIIGRCIKIHCDRNSSAEIAKELTPKEYRISKASALNLGDTLKALKISVLLEGIRPPKGKDFELVNESGRHKAQKYVSQSYTHAVIVVPFSHIQHALDNSIRVIADSTTDEE